MGEGMASLLLGVPEGQRLTGPPRDAQNTVYWGKDSAIFMEEVLGLAGPPLSAAIDAVTSVRSAAGSWRPR